MPLRFCQIILRLPRSCERELRRPSSRGLGWKSSEPSKSVRRGIEETGRKLQRLIGLRRKEQPRSRSSGRSKRSHSLARFQESF